MRTELNLRVVDFLRLIVDFCCLLIAEHLGFFLFLQGEVEIDDDDLSTLEVRVVLRLYFAFSLKK